MRFRGAAVAGVTLLVLAVGLPALGQAVGIYKVSWEATGQAYATAQGACGRVDLSDDVTQNRLWFCFGDSVAVRHGPGPGGEAMVVNVWVRQFVCAPDCEERTWTGVAPDVAYDVDPLLATATVTADLLDCGTVDLTLAASSEPDLRNEFGLGPPHVQAGPDFGQVQASGAGSASLGRDAAVNGVICGTAVPSGSAGRILRGLGSEGSFIEVSYV